MNLFQLTQWKHAIRMERMGMRHSSGRSVKAHACRELGLSTRMPHNDVIAHINELIETIRNGEVADTGPTIIVG